MEYEIKQVERHIIAGFHMVGPWGQTMKQGFKWLMMRVDGEQIVPLEQIAVYYDDSDVVLAEKLRCNTVVSMPEGSETPENSEGVIQTELAEGGYVIIATRVENHDFATPWYQFFERLPQDLTYAIAAKPCFEAYINNDMEDGHQDIEMYIPVQSKQLFLM